MAGWFDGILSNTVGVAYRAFTGVPDPWTISGEARAQAADQLRAKGIDPSSATAEQWKVEYESAKADVQHVVNTSQPPPCPGVKAGDAIGGLMCSLQKLGIYVVVAVAIFAGIYLYGKKLEGGG